MGEHSDTVEQELLKFIGDLYDATKRANAERSRYVRYNAMVVFAGRMMLVVGRGGSHVCWFRFSVSCGRVECEKLLLNYAKPIEDQIDSREITSVDRLRTGTRPLGSHIHTSTEY